MLEKKPALPTNVNPKNVAIRLFFRDALIKRGSKIVEYEEIINTELLYHSGDIDFECGKLAKARVKVSYRKGVLLIKTSDAVDVHVSGNIPAHAVQIKTPGDCVLLDGKFLSKNLRVNIAAKIIACEIPIENSKFIALLSNGKANNAVLVQSKISTNNLIIETDHLQLDYILEAGKGLITCKQIDSVRGGLVITGQSHCLINNQDQFDKLNAILFDRMNYSAKSKVTVANELTHIGILDLTKTIFSCDESINISPISVVKLSYVELCAKDLILPDHANVSGNNTVFKLNDAQINGNITIDILDILAENINVSPKGVLDGVSKLLVKPKQNLMVSGKITSENTSIDGTFVVAKFGGIINGTKSLNIDGMISALLFGSCLSGEKILNRAGVNINLFSLISGWCSSIDSLVGLELGNLYIPYADFTNGAQDLYKTVSARLKDMQDLPYKTAQDLYAELYNLAPKTTDEVWQLLSGKAGIIRAVLSTISAPASTVFNFSYQAISLIKQLIILSNTYALSSLENFTDVTSKDMIKLLLDLKGLVVSGNALHKNAIANYNNENNSTATVSDAAVNLASLYMPVSQNDTLFDASAPMLGATWTDTKQNWFSARAGNVVSWNQHEQTMYDQHDYSNRIAKNVTLSSGGTRYYGGNTKYNHMSVTAKNYIPSDSSLIQAIGDNALYSLTVDRYTKPAHENHQAAKYKLKDQPVSAGVNLLNGKEEFSVIQVNKSIDVDIESQETAEIGQSERGANIGHSFTNYSDIKLTDPLTGASLALKSTNGSIDQQKNILMEYDLSMEAAKQANKPSVTAESKKGNVFIKAGDLANNNNGGQIIANNGNSIFIGAKVQSNTNGAAQQSQISGKNTLIRSTSSAAELYNSIAQGLVTIKIETAENFELQPEAFQERLSQYAIGNVYKGTLIQGGTGTEENGWIGVEFVIGGSFNGAASTVGSIGKIKIYVRDNFYGETKATVFMNDDSVKKHGMFNKIYTKSENVNFYELKFISGDKINITCEHGQVDLLAVKYFAPNGTEILSKNQINADPVMISLRKSETKNKLKLFDKKTEFQDGVETVPVFAQTTGITSFTSLAEGITHKDTLYIGEPGSEFKFEAAKEISTTLNSLDHRVLETNSSLKFNAFGKTWIGSDNSFNMSNVLNGLDPTHGSAADFVESSNLPEAIINGANTMFGISNTLESVMENGIGDTISKQLGASLELYKSKKSLDYQTEALGGFRGGAKISMVSHHDDVLIGVNIYDNSDLYVKAKELYLVNKTLYSKYISQSISITPSVDAAGNYDVGADFKRDTSYSATQMQHYMFIGMLNLDVDGLHIRGTLVRCKDIMGRAPVIETEDVSNYNHSTHQYYSASLEGNASVSNLRTTEETKGAIGQLHVANGINNSSYHLDCQKHINHGEQGILTDEPTTNELNVEHEQHDQVLHSKRVGGSLSANISEKGKNQLSRITTDFQSKRDVVTEDGLQHMKNDKFKVTSVLPSLRRPDIQKTGSEVDETPKFNDNVSTNILDEQFLATPGFEHTKINIGAADILQKNATKANENSADDWTATDSYSEKNIRKSIDKFLSDPINRAVRNNRPTAKDIALNVIGSVAGIAQATVGDTLELIEATELPYIMTTGTSPYKGRKLQTIAEETSDAVGGLLTHGPMPLVTAYKDRYNAQMVKSAQYANNDNPFMAGFTSTRARAGVAMDAVAVVGLGGAVVRALPITYRFGANASNKLPGNIKNIFFQKELSSKSLAELAKPIDMALVQRLEEKGWTIVVAKEGMDEFRYLTYNGAEASIADGFPKHILIKETASKSALLEEFLHSTQLKIGLLEKYGSYQALEVHVKDFMLKHAQLLGLDNSIDIRFLQQLKLEEVNRLNKMGGL